MNMKNRIEVLENIVGTLREEYYKLREENRILNNLIKDKLYTEAEITKLYDNDGVVLLRLVKK